MKSQRKLDSLVDHSTPTWTIKFHSLPANCLLLACEPTNKEQEAGGKSFCFTYKQSCLSAKQQALVVAIAVSVYAG